MRHHPLLGEVKHGKVRAWSRSHRILESYSSHQNSGAPILALFSHSALRATPKAWAFRQVSHILCIVPILENVSTQQHTEWKCKCNRLLSPGPRTSWNSQLKPSNAMSSASSKSSSDFPTEISSSFIHTRIHTWIKQYKPKPKIFIQNICMHGVVFPDASWVEKGEMKEGISQFQHINV